MTQEKTSEEQVPEGYILWRMPTNWGGMTSPPIATRDGVTKEYPLRQGDSGRGRYIVIDVAEGDCWTTNDPPAPRSR